MSAPNTTTTTNAPARPGGACYHCGEPCPSQVFVLEGRNFCCFGCQTVFTLLRENGLDEFYRLQSTPGTRIRQAAARTKWAFLDDPAVAEQLLDYADKTKAKVTFHLPTIHCVACVWLLENLFKLHPGVGKVVVNFARREAAILYAPEQLKLSELATLLASIGYEPLLTLGETDKAAQPRISRKAWLQIGIAAFGFGNIMLMSLPFYLGLDSFNGPWFKLLAGWLSLGMTLPVVVFSAADFWRSAWLAWRQRALNLDVPIVLGLVAIYLTSAWEVLAQRGPGYCDSLCGLIFFLLCGRLFQKKTYDRLTFDRDYKGFFPLSVVRKTAAGETTVAISRLEVGDRIILRNGELLPADARLVSGEACLDYSFVTGEAEPVACELGTHLYAGGRQVGGAIEVETLKPVAQSYLATLWDNEAFRKDREQDLDSLTNRYSRRFTRLVILVAAAAAIYWCWRDAGVALKAFTSVLIVACPCALALAAPLTHGTAQRLLARLKIYLKNALVIERMAEVDTIVLDKTGTLTMADGRGVEFIPARPGLPEQMQWIGALARFSTHPNSLRIARALGAENREVTGFEEIPGSGLRGVIDGHEICLGARTWVLANAWKASDTELELPASAVYVAVDGVVAGAFSLQNSLRPEVESLLATLGDRYELALLSGDNEREAERFQKLFGHRAQLRFHQSPADKLNYIRELQARGHKVMMVGDGLNDAGALRQADVGVAVVEQVGVFSPASDVILDAAELPRLSRVLIFARQAGRVVRAGFVVSALYNLLGVTIAATGQLQPMVCAILMPISSATVVAIACGITAWLGRSLLAPNPFAERTPVVRPVLASKLVFKEAA